MTRYVATPVAASIWYPEGPQTETRYAIRTAGGTLLAKRGGETRTFKTMAGAKRHAWDLNRAEYERATAAQLALGVEHPLNGGGDALICAHGIGQCHALGEPGHDPLIGRTFTRGGASFRVMSEYMPGMYECRSARGEIVLSADEIRGYLNV